MFLIKLNYPYIPASRAILVHSFKTGWYGIIFNYIPLHIVVYFLHDKIINNKFNCP